MDTVSLTSLAQDHLHLARQAPAGRSALTLHGGHEHTLRQTMIALLAGQSLHEHESPGEATLQVLTGRVVMATASESAPESAELVGGEMVVVPDARHRLDALEDSVVVLTVSARLT